jgi:histidinol dehydrogenase
LADVIDPGLPAGPSECIIFADATVHGGLAALDLLIEAEHGPDSCAWLVTTAQTVVDQALDALPAHWAQMTPQRRGFLQTVLTRRFDGCL